MADTIGDGAIKVGWVTTLTSTTSPSTAEVTAGVDLETYIIPGGLDIQINQEMVDTSSIASDQYQEVPGRTRYSITLTMKNQGEAAAPFTTFASNPTGYLVVRYGVDADTDWTAAQKVWVFPAQAGKRQTIAPAANEVWKFSVPITVTGTVTEAVTLAA